jgi:hypothetical protein
MSNVSWFEDHKKSKARHTSSAKPKKTVGKLPRCQARLGQVNTQCSNFATAKENGFHLCWIHLAVELIQGAVSIYRGPKIERKESANFEKIERVS